MRYLQLFVADMFLQILQTVTHVMAPVVPHLAEEIHQTRFPEGSSVSSVFTEQWIPLVGYYPL